MKYRVELVVDSKSTLGEGSIWDHRRKVLDWVDIERNMLHEFNPATGENRTVALSGRPGTVVPRKAGGLVVAMEREIVVIDEWGGKPEAIASFPNEPEVNRMNDGKCDPAGRLWVGSISGPNTGKSGSLYAIEADGSYRTMLTEIGVSNGIVWSSDARTMYYVDTPTRRVDALDYDRASGAVTNRRPAITVQDGIGAPDGMTIDAEDKLWVAMWGGSAIRRFDPKTGEVLEIIEIPAFNVTSCAFGGDDLRDLYVTCARIGTKEETLAGLPNAGGLFVVRVDVPGVPASYFAG